MSPSKPRRLTRPERQADTRARILASAREQFVQHGIAGASVRDIAENAGFSQGAIYSNFQSKDEIILTLAREHQEALATLFEHLVESVTRAARGPGQEDAAVAAMANYLDMLTPEPRRAILTIELQLHANRNPEFARQLGDARATFTARLGRALERLFAHLGLVPPVDPAEIAMGFLSTSLGFAAQAGEAGPAMRKRVITAFFEAMLRSATPVAKS